MNKFLNHDSEAPALHWEVVYGCSQACPGCTSPKTNLRFTEPATLARGLDILRPKHVSLYGLGETFEHPALEAVLTVRDLMAIDSVIKTNGSFAPEVYFPAVGRVRRLLFCVDGVTNDVHRISRTTDGQAVLRTARTVAERARGTGTDVGIYMLVHRKNWHQAKTLWHIAREHGMLFEAAPYIPIQIGYADPQPQNSHLTMNAEERAMFVESFEDAPVLVEHFNWSLAAPHKRGAMVAWDGTMYQCLGTRLPLRQSIWDDSVDVPEKKCTNCPVSQMIVSLTHTALPVGAESLTLPPRVQSHTYLSDECDEVLEHREIWLNDCAVDPYDRFA